VARAKVDMSCRKPGCKTRSRGPRFGYVCEKHTGWTAEAKKVVAKKAAVRKVARKKAVVKAHTKKVTPPKSPTLSVVKSSAEA
jgi:hypothetical protein